MGGLASLRRYVVDDQAVHPKGRYVLAPGEVIRTWVPGCGGFGEPRERSREAVLADVRAGFVSPAAARREYGLDVTADGMSDSDTAP
jgi:N-methylhydantoinase B